METDQSQGLKILKFSVKTQFSMFTYLCNRYTTIYELGCRELAIELSVKPAEKK